MAIKHAAVSYYGFNYVEHAEKDFIEMKEHGCDTPIAPHGGDEFNKANIDKYKPLIKML